MNIQEVIEMLEKKYEEATAKMKLCKDNNMRNYFDGQRQITASYLVVIYRNELRTDKSDYWFDQI